MSVPCSSKHVRPVPNSPRDLKRARLTRLTAYASDNMCKETVMVEVKERRTSSNDAIPQVPPPELLDAWLRSSDIALVRRGLDQFHRFTFVPLPATSPVRTWIASMMTLFYSPHSYALKIEGLDILSTVMAELSSDVARHIVDVVTTLRASDLIEPLSDSLVVRVYMFADAAQLGAVQEWLIPLLTSSSTDDASLLAALQLVDRHLRKWASGPRRDALGWAIFWLMCYPSNVISDHACQTIAALLKCWTFQQPQEWYEHGADPQILYVLSHETAQIRQLCARYLLRVTIPVAMPMQIVRPLLAICADDLMDFDVRTAITRVTHQMTFASFRISTSASNVIEFPRLLSRLAQIDPHRAHDLVKERWKWLRTVPHDLRCEEIRLLNIGELAWWFESRRQQPHNSHRILCMLETCVDLSKCEPTDNRSLTTLWVNFTISQLQHVQNDVSMAATTALVGIIHQMWFSNTFPAAQTNQLRSTLLRLTDKPQGVPVPVHLYNLLPCFQRCASLGEEHEVSAEAALAVCRVIRRGACPSTQAYPLMRSYLQHSDVRVQRQACVTVEEWCTHPDLYPNAILEGVCGFGIESTATTSAMKQTMTSLISRARTEVLSLLCAFARADAVVWTDERESVLTSVLLDALEVDWNCNKETSHTCCDALTYILDRQKDMLPTQSTQRLTRDLVSGLTTALSRSFETSALLLVEDEKKGNQDDSESLPLVWIHSNIIGCISSLLYKGTNRVEAAHVLHPFAHQLINISHTIIEDMETIMKANNTHPKTVLRGYTSDEEKRSLADLLHDHIYGRAPIETISSMQRYHVSTGTPRLPPPPPSHISTVYVQPHWFAARHAQLHQIVKDAELGHELAEEDEDADADADDSDNNEEEEDDEDEDE